MIRLTLHPHQLTHLLSLLYLQSFKSLLFSSSPSHSSFYIPLHNFSIPLSSHFLSLTLLIPFSHAFLSRLHLFSFLSLLPCAPYISFFLLLVHCLSFSTTSLPSSFTGHIILSSSLPLFPFLSSLTHPPLSVILFICHYSICQTLSLSFFSHSLFVLSPFLLL